MNNDFYKRLWFLYDEFANRHMPKNIEVTKTLLQFCIDYGINLYELKKASYYRYKRDHDYNKNVIPPNENLQEIIENNYRYIFKCLLYYLFDAVGLRYWSKCSTYRSKIVEMQKYNLALPLKNSIYSKRISVDDIYESADLIKTNERNKIMVTEEIIQMNKNPENILMEVEMMTGQIDNHVKEMAKEYNKLFKKDLVTKIRQSIALNQVLAIICHHAPFHPDRKSESEITQAALSAMENDVIGYVGEYPHKIEEMSNYEFVAYLYQVGLYYSKVDGLRSEAFYPPITKDTLEEVSKIDTHIEFRLGRRMFKEGIVNATLDTMTVLFKNPDKEISKDLIFCHFINLLSKNIGVGLEFDSEKIISQEYEIEYSICQLKENLAIIRQLFHSNNI